MQLQGTAGHDVVLRISGGPVSKPPPMQPILKTLLALYPWRASLFSNETAARRSQLWSCADADTAAAPALIAAAAADALAPPGPCCCSTCCTSPRKAFTAASLLDRPPFTLSTQVDTRR